MTRTQGCVLLRVTNPALLASLNLAGFSGSIYIPHLIYLRDFAFFSCRASFVSDPMLCAHRCARCPFFATAQLYRDCPRAFQLALLCGPHLNPSPPQCRPSTHFAKGSVCAADIGTSSIVYVSCILRCFHLRDLFPPAHPARPRQAPERRGRSRDQAPMAKLRASVSNLLIFIRLIFWHSYFERLKLTTKPQTLGNSQKQEPVFRRCKQLGHTRNIILSRSNHNGRSLEIDFWYFTKVLSYFENPKGFTSIPPIQTLEQF